MHLASVLRDLYATLQWALNVDRFADVLFESFIAHCIVEVRTALDNAFEQNFPHKHQMVAVRLAVTAFLPAVWTFSSVDPVHTSDAN